MAFLSRPPKTTDIIGHNPFLVVEAKIVADSFFCFPNRLVIINMHFLILFFSDKSFSVKTLSMALFLPSMLICGFCSLSLSTKITLVNYDPWSELKISGIAKENAVSKDRMQKSTSRVVDSSRQCST